MFFKLLFCCLISLYCTSALSEDNKEGALHEEGEALASTEEVSGGNADSKEDIKSGSSDSSDLENDDIAVEEVALDSWIKKTPRTHAEEIAPLSPDENGALPERIDQKAAIEEEKKIYRDLVNTYKEKQKSNESIQRVFQKTAISKADQIRINKAKVKQKNTKKKIFKVYSQMSPHAIKKDFPTRICNMSYEIMSSPPEVKRFKQIPGKTISHVWKSSILKIGELNCDLVVVTGIVAKTSVKTEEFLAKTLLAIQILLGEDWRSDLITKGRVNSIALLYKPERIDIQSKKNLIDVALRRGEQFVEQNFSFSPVEVMVHEKKFNSTLRLLINDYIFEDSISKPLKVAHMLQISSGLRELAELRAKQDSIPTILSVNMRFVPQHPAYHVLVNSLTLNDFLSSGSCKIIETEEPVKKSKVKIKKISHECDEDTLSPTKRTLFNTFVDLYRLSSKSKDSEWQKFTSRKNSVTNGIFVLQRDISFVYPKDLENGPRAGYVSIGHKDLKAFISWTDFNFDKER